MTKYVITIHKNKITELGRKCGFTKMLKEKPGTIRIGRITMSNMMWDTFYEYRYHR